jgi:2-dehydro-3-deoxyphosphooctonate aldolase (KDO 8-P synthase)
VNQHQSLRPKPHVEVGSARFGNDLPFALVAGPCLLESRAHALETASALKEIADRLKIGLVYKSSFDKANRTSAASARGLGLDEALPIFAEIRENTGLPVTTDVHEAGHCAAVAEAVDALQIPAFLCRQTDLLVAAAHLPLFRPCSASPRIARLLLSVAPLVKTTSCRRAPTTAPT